MPTKKKRRTRAEVEEVRAAGFPGYGATAPLQDVVVMAPSPSILGAGKTKGRRSVEDYKTTGSGELWISSMPQDRGPEGNLKLWRDAEDAVGIESARAKPVRARICGGSA